ncbi:MAG TPA: gamma-glutamylcyclotransferase, partial [Spirochaetia bacterium]|nr:gamma-glutamylcyclotransferase [Spirochaetia bacterium]
ILPATGETVWGVLYMIEDDELKQVDRKEGYDWAYTRMRLPVRLEADGRELPAIIYTVQHKEQADVPPSRQYVGQMIAAANMRGLPGSYIEQLKAVNTAGNRA